ncbi:hypothetical protein N802_03155 [Knoellia sinensis KCTC 19936]|uniref:DUF4386 domain-containing protein n=1 Tax=Knoellia sinensis KCTC 19936 TaxID=1385520 RepID=A0A0A0J6N5_9MICO|nr:hypothetical protein [Knoellia sinensis]KGN31732.1 hypothetical protein N802_03155 [Knoellia sinensis KCTC 19936]
MNQNPLPRNALVPAALLAGLCPLVANTIHEEPTSSGADIIAAASAAQSSKELLSTGIFLVGFIALIAVLGMLAAAIAPRTPALSGIAAIGGAAAVAVKVAEAQTGIALRQTAAGLDPTTAEALVAMDEAGFAVHGLLLSVAFGAVGMGLLAAGLVPRWLAWWATVMGGLGVVTALVGVMAPAAYVPIPFLFLLVWLTVLGIVGARRPFAHSAVPAHVAAAQ